MTDDVNQGTVAALGFDFSKLDSLLADEDQGYDPARIVEVAGQALPHAHHCGITLLRDRHPPQSLSSTDGCPDHVDRIQFECREGPCLSAATEGVEVANSLGTDERWPTFGPRCVAETGIASMLSVRLSLSGSDYAALNFYARKTDVFEAIDIATACMFAPFAALSVERTLRDRDTEDFKAALSTSRQIGTAIGILMSRHFLTSQDAFELLRAASQRLNRKLRDLAAEVELTGELPSQERD